MILSKFALGVSWLCPVATLKVAGWAEDPQSAP